MKTQVYNLFETLRRPLRFLWRVIRKFHSNKGLILAGAIAYNTLLSIIPAFTLLLIILSHLVDDQTLLVAVESNLKLVIPGLTDTLLKHAAEFLNYRRVVGWISVAVMLFFSSIAFMVLENTMAVIFSHRAKAKRRPFIISAIMPYIFTLVLVLALSVVTLMSGALEAMEDKKLTLFFWTLHLDKVNDITLYLLGFGGLIVLLSSIYMVLPIGGIKVRYALIGGAAAAVLWEIVRHFLIWYFSNLSIVNVIYGSMATAVVALLSLEVAGVILLFGAQFIAEYEQIRDKGGLVSSMK